MIIIKKKKISRKVDISFKFWSFTKNRFLMPFWSSRKKGRKNPYLMVGAGEKRLYRLPSIFIVASGGVSTFFGTVFLGPRRLAKYAHVA